MGGDDAGGSDEPLRDVTLTDYFYLGTYEVTQAEWEKVMGDNPGEFKGDDRRPVENVSWHDAQAFVDRLNAMEGTKKYRLPTEAEWEYAARAGTSAQYSFGDDDSELHHYAWYHTGDSIEINDGNAESPTHPVGEWVEDEYAKDRFRVLRGGSWRDFAKDLRSAHRDYCVPMVKRNDIGFRLAFSPDQ